MKKGQVSFFVILGLVFSVLIILLFTFKGTVIEQAGKIGIIKGISLSEESKMVQSDVGECMKEEAYNSLIKLGLQGGYLDLERITHAKLSGATDFLDYDGTAYLYYKGQNKVPSLMQMQNDLIEDLIIRSTNCKKTYKDLTINYGRAVPKTEIKEDKIIFKINWVIDIQKDDSKSTVKYVNFEMPLRLGKIREVLNEIVESQTEEICISCLTETGFKNHMTIDIENAEGDIFYLITDEKSKIRDKNYMFLIANKF
ncbi:MAG: hypothetical protein ISS23_00510 [Nanoarchaeota archaeon]|nr:hypothetical protein [Nanoarchaeota archaeon]